MGRQGRGGGGCFLTVKPMQTRAEPSSVLLLSEARLQWLTLSSVGQVERFLFHLQSGESSLNRSNIL